MSIIITSANQINSPDGPVDVPSVKRDVEGLYKAMFGNGLFKLISDAISKDLQVPIKVQASKYEYDGRHTTHFHMNTAGIKFLLHQPVASKVKVPDELADKGPAYHNWPNMDAVIRKVDNKQGMSVHYVSRHGVSFSLHTKTDFGDYDLRCVTFMMVSPTSSLDVVDVDTSFEMTYTCNAFKATPGRLEEHYTAWINAVATDVFKSFK